MLKRFIHHITNWETWQGMIKYIPISPAWIWYCIRSGNAWFFTGSNPSLKFGGFAGDTKKEMYKKLPEDLYPHTLYISPDIKFSEVAKIFESGHFSFPVAVKPDVGTKGLMFRKIENMAHLRQYHYVMPSAYLIQDFIDYPMEISVFYYRMPNEKKGTITGLVKKEFPELTGDGYSTLSELMDEYPRVSHSMDEMRSEHRNHLNRVIPVGQKYCLSYALNPRKGGKLVSLEYAKDERLQNIFDQLSHHAGDLYYGRYDIRCHSIEELRQGRNFSILAYKGAGAEPQHVYGNHNTLLGACRILLQHWHMLYRISAYNHKHGGQPYWSYKEGLEFSRNARKHYLRLQNLDSEFHFDRPVAENEGTLSHSLAGLSQG